MDEKTLARFWARVEKQDGGCWLWTPRERRIYVTRRYTPTAARAAWEHWRGPVPGDGMVVSPDCDGRCVNPSHMRIRMRPRVTAGGRMNDALLRKFFGRFTVTEGLSSPHVGTPCWRWTGNFHSQGYGKVGVGRGYELAHRLAFQHWHRAIPGSDNDANVMHACDNRWCVNPEHLSLGTTNDNIDDAARKLRLAHFMTPERVLLIIRMVEDGHTWPEVADAVGASQGTVSDVLAGRTWAWLTGRGQA